MPAVADDPFGNMLAQMDRAEEYADVNHGVFERLKYPKRTLRVTLPVELESGEVEVFEGYRCQFDSARGPFKGGVRFHPSVTQREVEATGRGVSLVTERLFEYLDRDLSDATIAIQGFGNVGSNAARLLDEAGANVVATSDVSGAAYDPDGLDVAALGAHVDAGGLVEEYVAGEVRGGAGAVDSRWDDPDEVTNAVLLTLDVDVLIPAAVEGVITEENVDDLRASAIVEAANGPTTVAADKALTERDVQVVPDILANAGGVIVSYLEWVQNAQEFS